MAKRDLTPEELEARRAANAKTHREQSRRWRQANPEAAKRISARYRETHLESRTATIRAWQEANKERVAAKRREWHAANPHKRSEWESRRRAQKYATRIEPVSYADIIERDRSVCHLCGKKVPKGDIHIDHIVPLSKGGEHTSANLAVAHSKCNLSKNARAANDQLRLVG